MWVKALFAAALTAAIVVAVGCHHDKYHLTHKVKEECVLPPDQARFNDPPSAEWRKPPPKGEEKTLLGNKDKMAGPIGTPGF